MAIRKLRYDGDPILAKRASEVEEINDRIKELVDDMFETMYKYNGVGLAAPQVGVSRRVLVIDTEEPGEKMAMINPEIIEFGKKTEWMHEGCLSFPGLSAKVLRHTFVKAKALDKNGKEFTVEAVGLLAQAIQHEVDHLNGIVFTDLADPDSYYVYDEDGKKVKATYNKELHKITRSE